MEFHCVVCGAAAQPATGVCFICTQCGFPLKIIAGEELQIEYIDVVTEEESFAWNQVHKESQSRPMS
jgi:hydrogenase nickel incorporation protein HypA/HybF